MNKNFIKATNDYTTAEHHVPAPLLRKSFALEALPENASLSICGLGFYTLRVNGTDITKGHMAPYVSNPDDICYYDTYDVLPYLREGENVIGIMLGNGFLNCPGGAVWDFEKSVFRGAPRVALELVMNKDGDSTTIVADESFRTHPSPILLDDERMGETYDATRELDGWDKAGFDDSEWQYAMRAETVRGDMKPCVAEPIRVMEERRPVSITRKGDAYLYDFGVNSAGVCRLRVNARRGQTITMWHGEILKDGEFYNDNICFSREKYPFYNDYNQTVRYTASGNGTEIYTPSFSYYGFRYVLVEGLDEEQATDSLLTYLVMSSDIETIGGFECSDETVNKLFAMTVNADRSNFFYFPTDCPHREKNGWTGDASMSSDHMAMLYDVSLSWRQWLDNIRKAQNDRGELPGIVPTSGWGFKWGNGPTWDSVLFNLPYMLFKYRGDTEVIRENAHAMLRYLEYALTRRGEDGTIAIGLGDWVPVGKRASAYDVPLAFTDSVMVMDCAKKTAEMLRAIGHTHGASFAEGIYNDMRETIRRELVDTDSAVVKGECQSGQCIGLYYGVFNEDERQRAFEKLVEYINKKDGSFDCGFIGLHCIFHVLSEFGESELAYKMIMKDTYPSYKYFINVGETSIPEQVMLDPLKAGSHNHHFLGDISRWFIREIAGLKVIDSKTVSFNARPIADITSASAWYDLPAGRVSIEWSLCENGELDIRTTVPEGVEVIK